MCIYDWFPGYEINVFRSEWEGDIAQYSPRFHDGWTPGVISFFMDDQPDFGHDKNEEFVLRKISRESSRVMFTNFMMEISRAALSYYVLKLNLEQFYPHNENTEKCRSFPNCFTGSFSKRCWLFGWCSKVSWFMTFHDISCRTNKIISSFQYKNCLSWSSKFQ